MNVDLKEVVRMVKYKTSGRLLGKTTALVSRFIRCLQGPLTHSSILYLYNARSAIQGNFMYKGHSLEQHWSASHAIYLTVIESLLPKFIGLQAGSAVKVIKPFREGSLPCQRSSTWWQHLNGPFYVNPKTALIRHGCQTRFAIDKVICVSDMFSCEMSSDVSASVFFRPFRKCSPSSLGDQNFLISYNEGTDYVRWMERCQGSLMVTPQQQMWALCRAMCWC